MDKRIKQLLVMGMTVLMLTGGCGKATEPTEQNETIQSEEQNSSEEMTDEEQIPQEESFAVPCSIHVDENKKTYYLQDGETAYLYLQYCDVTADNVSNENLKRNIENWSMERAEEIRGLSTSFKEEAADSAKSDIMTYSFYQSVAVSRVDSKIVSLIEDFSQYTGGAHGSNSREGICFDAQTGKKLMLSDLFSDYDTFKKEALKYLKEQLAVEYEEQLFEDYEETAEKMWSEETFSWYPDASGIVVVFPEYSVGPYATGIAEIHLPYAQFKQYIKQAYLPDHSDGIARLDKNQQVILSLTSKNGENEEVPFLIDYVWKDDEPDQPTCYVKLGNRSVKLDSFSVLEEVYLIRKEGEVYCLVGVDQASDDYYTYVYRLTDGKIREAGSTMAAIDKGNINLDTIIMEEKVDFLGSYTGKRTYRFNEGHELKTEETEFDLQKNEIVLTTSTELTVTLEGKEGILPVGSHVLIKATDDQTYVRFIIQETGQSGLMDVVRDENDYYNISINGKDEHDCFKILPYAG